LELEKQPGKNQAGNELDEGILKRDFGLTGAAPAHERKEAHYRYQLIPLKLILAHHAGTPATEGLLGIKSKNDDIQKAPNNETKGKEDNYKNWHHILFSR
jgi:hypothetical protein